MYIYIWLTTRVLSDLPQGGDVGVSGLQLSTSTQSRDPYVQISLYINTHI